MKFNAKAVAVLARQFDLLAHELFAVILGLSAWKGTLVGVLLSSAAWLVCVLFAFVLRSFVEDDDADAGDEDDQESESG